MDGCAASGIQVLDDYELLEEMMSGLMCCDQKYRPTNYWSHYQKEFMPELRREGLRDYRRRQNSLLASFGATDRLVRPTVTSTSFLRIGWIMRNLLHLLQERLHAISSGVTEVVPSEFSSYFYWQTRKKFEDVGLDIRKCPTSAYGNPEDLSVIEGGCWSTMHLQYCSMVADALRHITVGNDVIFCELGTGMGRNCEVLAHLFKNGTFFLFDIPPQLYVANQYLQKVFPNRVVPYRDAVKALPGRNGSLPESLKGKIIIQPSWRMPDWANTKIDVFWNSASFQEMEPDVVENYIGLVKKMYPEWVYINALPQGNFLNDGRSDVGGCLKQVSEECFMKALDAGYSLERVYFTDYFLRNRDYKSYIFKKR